MKIQKVKIVTLKSHPKNPNQHPQEQIVELENSIKQFDQVKNIVVWRKQVIAGNGLLIAAKKRGLKEIEICDISEWPEEKAISFMVADNRLADIAIMDYNLLTELLKDLGDPIDIPGVDERFLDEFDFGDKLKNKNITPKGSLLEDFIVPPFSIFDTKKGYWIDRKRLWMKKINDNGESRDETLSDVLIPNTYHSGKGLTHVSQSVSILDPVLSEIINLWFGIKNCKVFDCFAGDTVFGYVSSFLGNAFIGIELREEQVRINQKRCNADNLAAQYICDDGRNVQKYIQPQTQDLFFSCPPYFDLEIYSELENDASNQKLYTEFYSIIDTAFSKSAKCLKEDRFAVIVCGDVRDKKSGMYYDFPSDIKNTFKKNGLILYNEIIMCERIGTACMKAANYMKNRKVVKTHQNILVFYKGDTKKIKVNFPILRGISKERIETIESPDME